MNLAEFKRALREELRRPLPPNIQAERDTCLANDKGHTPGRASYRDVIFDASELADLPRKAVGLLESNDEILAAADENASPDDIPKNQLPNLKSAAIDCRDLFVSFKAAALLASDLAITHEQQARLMEALIEYKDEIRSSAIKAFDTINGLLIRGDEDNIELRGRDDQLNVDLQPPYQGKYLDFMEEYALDFATKLERLVKKASAGRTPALGETDPSDK